jgi:NTE family protein
MTMAKTTKSVKTSKAGAEGPTFALALGGGGARGLAHIHVLEILDEMGIRPVAVSGSSIGAIIGAAYASGMSGKDIRDHVLSVLGNRTEVMNRLWKLRTGGFGGLLTGWMKLIPVDIEKVLDAFLPEAVARDFKDLMIPLTITGTEYYQQRTGYFTQGDLRSAIAASAAIPAVFRAVRREGAIYVDGGMTDPVPFEVLEGKADYIIGIDVVGSPEGEIDQFPGTIDSLFGASQLMMQAIISLKLRNNHPAIFLRPSVNAYRVMDFLKAKTILETTAPIRDELKRAVEAAITFHAKANGN